MTTGSGRGVRLARAIARAPVRPLRVLTGGGPVIVLAPHPDDEAFGCGGLIAACVAAGIDVHVWFVTDGARSHPGSASWPEPRIAARRKLEGLRSCRALGVPPARVVAWRLPDGELAHDLSRLQRLAAQLGRRAARLGAAALFATWEGDPHPDHVATALLARAIRRGARRAKVWFYPIWAVVGEAATLPPWPGAIARLGVGRHRGRKAAAIAAHRSQVTRLIHDWDEAGVPAPADRRPFLRGYEPFFADPVRRSAPLAGSVVGFGRL